MLFQNLLSLEAVARHVGAWKRDFESVAEFAGVVSLGNDADELVTGHHEQGPDVVLGHFPDGCYHRIVGLDGGVCITLSSLLHPSGALAKAPRISQIWRRIWLDEARHVRISRRHVVDLGIAQTRLMEEGLQVRASLADLLRPLGDDFENMGVDPDRLFRRVAGSEEDGAGAVSTR